MSDTVDLAEERRLARERAGRRDAETRPRTRALVILGATRPGATRQELEEAALSNYGHFTDAGRAEIVAAALEMQQEGRAKYVAPEPEAAASAATHDTSAPADAAEASPPMEDAMPETVTSPRNRTDLSDAERDTIIAAIRNTRRRTGREESAGALRDWIAEDTGIHVHLSTFNKLVRRMDGGKQVTAPVAAAEPAVAVAEAPVAAGELVRPASTWTLGEVEAALEFVGVPAEQVERALGLLEFLGAMVARREAARA